MSYTPEDLQTAQQHVAEAEKHVVRQEEIVTEQRLKGSDTSVAEALLAEFQASLKMHRHDRDRIAAELRQSI